MAVLVASRQVTIVPPQFHVAETPTREAPESSGTPRLAPRLGEPSASEAWAWLQARHLTTPPEGQEAPLSDDQAIRRFMALSKCAFGEAVDEDSRREFLQRLLPSEAFLAARQTDIGEVRDPRFHYRLRLTNETPITTKPMRFRPEEEAWLDAHLDELMAKGVIGPILPHENPRCVTPLLLVPG